MSGRPPYVKEDDHARKKIVKRTQVSLSSKKAKMMAKGRKKKAADKKTREDKKLWA